MLLLLLLLLLGSLSFRSLSPNSPPVIATTVDGSERSAVLS